MKRLLAFLSIFALIALTACSGSTASATTAAADVTTETTETAVSSETTTETESTISAEEQLAQDTLTEADELLNAGDYAGTLEDMLAIDSFSEYTQYETALVNLLNNCIDGNEWCSTAANLIAAIPADEKTAQIILNTVTGRCEAGSYNAFLFADYLLGVLGGSANVSGLTDYIASSAMQRAAAYISADWERTDTGVLYLFVMHIYCSEGDNSGYLTYVNESVNSYGFVVGDKKLSDIVFSDAEHFTCGNLTRYADGTTAYDNAEVTIDYTNGLLDMYAYVDSNNVSGSAQHWRRISTEPEMLY